MKKQMELNVPVVKWKEVNKLRNMWSSVSLLSSKSDEGTGRAQFPCYQVNPRKEYIKLSVPVTVPG
jgi:hypothetical protein